MTEEGMRFEDLIRNVERSRVETERLREEASRLEAEARAASEKAKNEASQLVEKRKALIAEAREEARERYRDAEAEIEQLIQKIRGGIKAADERERLKEAEEIRQAIRSGRTRVENEIGRATLGAGGGFRKVANPVVGEIYEAPNLGFTGKLIEGPDKNGNVILSSGPMQISVKQDQLARPAGVPTGGGRKKSRGTVSAARAAGRGGQGKFGQGSGSISMDRHLHAGTELMLLGNTVDEALEKLDKFIDDAVLTGVSSLRVVHGKGTGALRSAVQQHLKQDSRVKSFRLGAYGEGDSGVTLVELK
ncbi:MAG: Smr/MutS family protein [Saccharofermentanales bacterium]